MSWLEDIEQFGLQNVDHAGDLTDFQRRFLHLARNKRREMMAPDDP